MIQNLKKKRSKNLQEIYEVKKKLQNVKNDTKRKRKRVIFFTVMSLANGN